MAHPLERFYPLLPVWMQNFGISLYGFAYRSERLGGAFHKHVSAFRQRERWSTDQMRDFVEQRLRAVLLGAHDRVPYYREAFERAGFSRTDLSAFNLARLSNLPRMTKEDMLRNGERLIAQDIAKSDLQRYFTSGSTGTPVSTVCTADGHRRFIAAREARSFNWAGCTIEGPRSMLGGRLIVPKAYAKPPYYRYNWVERQVYLSAYHIRPATLDNYIEALNRYRPPLLTGYAYSHYLLAKLMAARNRRLDYEPAALVLSSEKLTAEMKDVIFRTFRARAYEEYGCVEQCALATECEYGSLHVSPDFGIVEILDDEDRPVPPGVDGRLVCTSLHNDAQPLIRYEMSDLARWSPRSCPCGRDALPVLEELVGRIEDAVVLEDGTELVRFHGIFIDLPHVVAGQIVQDEIDHIHVNVIATEGFGADDERLIRHRLTTQRVGEVRVDIHAVSDLERTARGKIRGVISRLPSGERERVRERWRVVGGGV